MATGVRSLSERRHSGKAMPGFFLSQLAAALDNPAIRALEVRLSGAEGGAKRVCHMNRAQGVTGEGDAPRSCSISKEEGLVPLQAEVLGWELKKLLVKGVSSLGAEAASQKAICPVLCHRVFLSIALAKALSW